MQIVENMIRGLFFIVGLFSLIASGWVIPYASNLYIFTFLLLIAILFFVSFSSTANRNSFVYSIICIIGLFISIYFVYDTFLIKEQIPYIELFNTSGFIILLALILVHHKK